MQQVARGRRLRVPLKAVYALVGGVALGLDAGHLARRLALGSAEGAQVVEREEARQVGRVLHAQVAHLGHLRQHVQAVHGVVGIVSTVNEHRPVLSVGRTFHRVLVHKRLLRRIYRGGVVGEVHLHGLNVHSAAKV